LASPKSITLIFSYGVQNFAELSQEPADTARAEPAFIIEAQHIQGDAPDVFHHDARPLRVIERGIVQGDGIRVLKPRHQQRLALEALAELGVGRQVVVHNLDDYLPAQVKLSSKVDPAHAALAQKAQRLIPT
jgi:hypothetical protein